jgi:heme oxygenase (staphylobilin-producing)
MKAVLGLLIQTRTIVVEKGHGDKIIERFSQEGPLDGREGLIDITIMTNKRNKEADEVMVMIRWESEDAWKAWEKSPEHIQGHRNSRGQSAPEYIISTTVHMYEVNKVKQGGAVKG